MPSPARAAHSGGFPSLAIGCALVLTALLPAYGATYSYPPHTAAAQGVVRVIERSPFKPIEGSIMHAGMKAHNAARSDRDRERDREQERERERERYGRTSSGSTASNDAKNESGSNRYCNDLDIRMRSNTQQAKRATTIHSRDKIENERRAIRKSQSELGCSHF